MKGKIKSLFFLVLIIVSVCFLGSTRKIGLIEINEKKFIAQIAENSQDKKTGLSKRNDFCRDCAMLFIFSNPEKYAFWMKDMNFDLDIIWFLNDKIVHIEKNVSKDDSRIIDGGVLADKVVEVKAGLAEKYEFKIGSQIKIYFPFDL